MNKLPKALLYKLLISTLCFSLIALSPQPSFEPTRTAGGDLDPAFGTGGLVTTNIGRMNSRSRAIVVQPDGKIVLAGTDVGPALVRYLIDGSLDIQFGDGGRVVTDFGYGGSGNAVALQADGRIVVAGTIYTGSWPEFYSDFALARYNSDGGLDASFGEGGKVITSLGGNDDAYAVALQGDGKIVVAGTTDSDFALARYTTDGSLDTSFSDDGKVTTDFGGYYGEYGYAVALQADGKIVVAGTTTYDFALVRYTTDGSLDTSFGVDGKVTTDFGGSYGEYGYAIALQADGKIVVAGTTTYDFALARYTTDGNLDTSFSDDGKVTTDFYGSLDYGYAIALQADGRILVAGTTGYDFALARYNSDGSLDNSFSVDGKLTTDFGGSYGEYGYAVALQADGKIVAAGSAYIGSATDFALVRYNADGSLDTFFGDGGKVTTEFDGTDSGSAIALQADGKIVMVGTSNIGDYSSEFFALVRYNPDGSLDASFGDGGKVITSFSGRDNGYAVAVQADGKIVAAGVDGSLNHFALARYNSDGSLDKSFGEDGTVSTWFGGNAEAHAIALQPDGKIVVAGYAFTDTDSMDFALIRYNSDGSLDNSFGGDGRVRTDFGGPDYAMDLALQADGKIVAVGYGYGPSSEFNFALARYTLDGSLDVSFGDGGKVITEIPIGCCDDRAMGIALQADGKIVAAGYAFGGTTDYDFVLVRYNTDGSLDVGFGDNGQVSTDFGGAEWGYAVALQVNGKIVVAGTAGSDFALVRYRSDGSLDTCFGDGGKVITDFGGDSSGADVAIQADSKIVVAGTAPASLYPHLPDFALARYESVSICMDYLPAVVK